MTSIGISCNFSKLSAQSPIIKPNIAKVTDVKTRKKTIIKGCSIFKSTNKPAVKIITLPIINDLVAAAPTKPNIISKLDNGADKIS